jgi:phage baseplate assembly protein gpV
MSFAAAEADRRIANIISIGRVSAIDAANSAAKVQIGDLITPFIQVNVLRAGGFQFWWMPTVGEQVVVGAPSGDYAQAVILCSIFAGNAPSADPAVPTINLAGGSMTVIGTINVTGSINVTKDVTAAGVSLVGHTHPESIGTNTGVPR